MTDDLACIDAVELVTDYLEAALTPEAVQRLELHLETCPGCTDYVEQLRTIAGSLAGVTEESLPPDVRAAVIAAFRDR
jgi:hypothetical protein